MKRDKSDPREHYCFRCEPLGIRKKADMFVSIDGLLNEEKQPLCKECNAEWKKEFNKLVYNQPLFNI